MSGCLSSATQRMNSGAAHRNWSVARLDLATTKGSAQERIDRPRAMLEQLVQLTEHRPTARLSRHRLRRPRTLTTPARFRPLARADTRSTIDSAIYALPLTSAARSNAIDAPARSSTARPDFSPTSS